ncbi:MAG: hydrolase, partial [Sphingobacteriales bacterium]
MPNFRIKLLIFILLPFISWSQKRTTAATKISEKITIDAKMDEAIWATAEVATNFVMFEPDNGKPEAFEQRTEVRTAYDDEAVYFAAIIYDDPAKILKELSLRDDFKTADHFGVYLNGFNDGQQDFRFFVSAAGTQMDCLATQSGEDYSWDAIWHSEVRITEFGWIVEMKIPHAALRFSEENVQFWGLNFYREVRRDRQKYTWNPVDRNIGATIVQTGLLTGIENIKPPTRLFFIPYTSLYVSKNEKGTETKFKGGMDLKYGINDSFTLDAILVPDFGQAAFDPVVLNLGPFEQQFNENRPFFTEGTDIFNKGGLLYTRRIGGAPNFQPQVGENEELSVYPTSVNLINALKVSGRTKNGLGIGVMNAITEQTYATVRNTATGQTRNVEVAPLTNYSVMVLDQRFRKNSSVSLVNTNVTRNGEFRDANASALIYNLNDRENAYNLSGNFKFSYVEDITAYNGYSSYISAGRTKGKYRYSVSTYYISKEFDVNDLGINNQTNYHNLLGSLSYRILNPTKNYNTFQVNTSVYSEFQNDTGMLQASRLTAGVNSTTRSNDYIGYEIEVNPFNTYDFYEPRVAGRYVLNPKSIYAGIYFSSNYNRKFAFDIEPDIWISDDTGRNYYGLSLSPRYRFNDKLQMVYSFNYGLDTKNKGWVGFEGDEIVFTERDRATYTNTLSGKYSVNNKMTINLTARHYWTYGENLEFLTLEDNGELSENTTFNENRDFTYNNWNFDLSYTWWFAPGSQLSVLYRNNAVNNEEIVNRNYRNNLDNLFSNNLNSIFSISLR